MTSNTSRFIHIHTDDKLKEKQFYAVGAFIYFPAMVCSHLSPLWEALLKINTALLLNDRLYPLI